MLFRDAMRGPIGEFEIHRITSHTYFHFQAHERHPLLVECSCRSAAGTVSVTQTEVTMFARHIELQKVNLHKNVGGTH